MDLLDHSHEVFSSKRQRIKTANPLFSLLIALPVMTPIFLAYTSPSWATTITAVAGDGIAGYSGDGGDATNAQLNYTNGVTVDVAGNIFIADTFNHRVRRVDPSGMITTVAGNGTAGYSGDGGDATNAQLSQIQAIAVDAAGNIFIADYAANRIRRVDTSGIITTVAGNGISGYSGDGGDATEAQLNNPAGIAVDTTGNIFIADYSNYRIRRVDTSGIITTVAGIGISGYNGDGGAATGARMGCPRGLAVDAAGNLFIADAGNNRIRRVDTSGIITTVAGNGTYGYSGDGAVATTAKFKSPNGIAVDAAGNLFIADTNNSRIRRVDTSGIITTVAGNGSHGYNGDDQDAASAKLYGPQAVAIDTDGNIFIADTLNHRIRKVWCSHVVYGKALLTIAGHTNLEIPNATATLEGDLSYSATTNGHGKFYFGSVLPDTYTLSLSEPNLSLLSQEITISEESLYLGTFQMTVLNQDDFNQAMANAEAAKAAAIAQKDIVITDLSATVAIKDSEINSLNTTVTNLTTTIDSMFTQTQLDQAVSEAETAMNALIASKENQITGLNSAVADLNATIDSMFTRTQLDQAVTEVETTMNALIASKENQITGLNTAVADLNATIDSMFTRTQLDQAVTTAVQYWDAMGDGKIGLEEAIHSLQIVSGTR